MVKKMAMIDWKAMKYYHIRTPILFIFICFVGIAWTPLLVLPSCAMMSFVFSINTFAVEEKGELNNLYLTLPVKRSDVVKGRYLLSFIMGICGLIVGIPIMMLTNYIGSPHYNYPIKWNILIIALSYLFFALCNISMYPVLFRMGYNKGKFWGFYLPVIFISVLYGVAPIFFASEEKIAFLWDMFSFVDAHILVTSASLGLLATFIIWLSFLLSKYLYEKREF